MLNEGGDDASHRPSFFRVLLLGFNKKLPLPRAFIKNLTKEQPRKNATLVNPNGKSWPVNLLKEKNKEDMHFGGETWEHFVHAHKLGFGYFLVFFHRRNMVFDFRAYDLSTCEIIYPSLAPKKRKIVETKKQQAKDQDSIPGCSKRKRKRCGGLLFEAKIGKYNISKSYMNIPNGFMREHGEFARLEELTLKDPEGRTWRVQLFHRKTPRKYASGTHISTGWTQFAQGNKLKVGDKCIFELVSCGKGKVMNVQIIRLASDSSS